MNFNDRIKSEKFEECEKDKEKEKEKEKAEEAKWKKNGVGNKREKTKVMGRRDDYGKNDVIGDNCDITDLTGEILVDDYMPCETNDNNVDDVNDDDITHDNISQDISNGNNNNNNNSNSDNNNNKGNRVDKDENDRDKMKHKIDITVDTVSSKIKNKIKNNVKVYKALDNDQENENTNGNGNSNSNSGSNYNPKQSSNEEGVNNKRKNIVKYNSSNDNSDDNSDIQNGDTYLNYMSTVETVSSPHTHPLHPTQTHSHTQTHTHTHSNTPPPSSTHEHTQDDGNLISIHTMHMIFFAGLRGAVAFACANIFPDTNGNRKLIVGTTTGIILITIFVGQ